jgi:hypothetical protein
MADPLKYDRSAAFEMLQKQHGEYASPEQINQELDNYEKANGLGAPVEQTAPIAGSAPAPLTGQDKSIADQAANYALVPSTARETVNAITAPPVGSTSLPDVLSAAWNNLSTPEKYAVGGSTAAVGSLAVYGAKKLVDRFLISDKQATPPIDRTRDIPMGDTKPPPPPPPPPEGPKLSTVDQQILDRQAINKPVRDAYLKQISGGTPTAETPTLTSNKPPVGSPVTPVSPVQASATTENEFLKKMEEKYGPLPSKTSTVAPELATTPEQQVKAIKETEAPAPAPVKQPPTKAPPKPKMDMPEGWGKGMSWLTTVHGVEGAQAFIDQYNNGKPFATHKEMDDKYREVTIRPKYSDIPKELRRERNIPLRSDIRAVPPPSLRPNEIGQGGGSLIRSLTDPLQLKQ